jgi:hypothetical protein
MDPIITTNFNLIIMIVAIIKVMVMAILFNIRTNFKEDN